MMCWRAKRKISDYVDGRLRPNEHSRVRAHLRDCGSCSAAFDDIRSVRSSLLALPSRISPADLKIALRIRASRERQAVLERRESLLRRLWNRWTFQLDQLMRPLTIPATGGLLSSIILFGALAHTIGSSAQAVGYEVPVVYADHAAANLVPLELRESVILTLSLDTNGHITDYAVRDASASFVGDASRLQANNISLPEFPSVFELPLPISSDISIRFTPIVFRQ